MKKMAVLLICSLALACKGPEQTAGEQEQEVRNVIPKDRTACQTFVDLDGSELGQVLKYADAEKLFQFPPLDTAYLAGDRLHLSFHYSGCDAQEYQAYVKNSSAGKKAVLIDIGLFIRDPGQCESYFEESDCWDLPYFDLPSQEYWLVVNQTDTLVYRP